ncbi:hypothetical protein F511_44642 [Dorcoceras hygrometricum]|uniref:Uncharacterized protein n=1 Tax=Dorcoceras hygrometricum TaxID=472368 RepID=A0A2Z7D5Z1_9LAMI|nr:hypothetical protein F511_44642 [Dorcoceras hygrometricum]
MASSLISSSHHIDFDSVFSMEDVILEPVFESLIITGLKEFLGCPAIFYEAALTEFFANGSVRDGVVASTIGGTVVEISESIFAATFELPSEGLTDLSDVPKNLVFDARSLFSDSKEQAKGFAIQIGVVLSNIPGLELGEPRAFPPPRVLNEKTVHRFVHINEKFGVEKTTGSPPMKKTPKKRVVSKKRPVDIAEVATGEREPVAEVTTGDADAAIEQVLAQLDLVFKDSDVERGDRNVTWFDRALDEELDNANQEIQDSEDGTDFVVDFQELPVLDETRTVLEAASVVEEDFVPHGCLIEPFQYWGAAPYLIKTWGWERVCTEVIRYGMFGCLRPVREDICRDIVVSNLGVERIPAGFQRIFRQGMDSNSFANSFVQLDSVDIQSIQEFESASSDGSTVYRSPSPILQKDDYFDQEEQLYIVESPESSPSLPQRQESSSSSSDSQMHF